LLKVTPPSPFRDPLSPSSGNDGERPPGTISTRERTPTFSLRKARKGFLFLFRPVLLSLLDEFCRSYGELPFRLRGLPLPLEAMDPLGSNTASGLLSFEPESQRPLFFSQRVRLCLLFYKPNGRFRNNQMRSRVFFGVDAVAGPFGRTSTFSLP